MNCLLRSTTVQGKRKKECSTTTLASDYLSPSVLYFIQKSTCRSDKKRKNKKNINVKQYALSMRIFFLRSEEHEYYT